MVGNPVGALLCILLTFIVSGLCNAGAETEVRCYSIHEISFEGPTYRPTDAPARDVDLITRWRHQPSGTTLAMCKSRWGKANSIRRQTGRVPNFIHCWI